MEEDPKRGVHDEEPMSMGFALTPVAVLSYFLTLNCLHITKIEVTDSLS